jgi:hypothetical protein
VSVWGCASPRAIRCSVCRYRTRHLTHAPGLHTKHTGYNQIDSLVSWRGTLMIVLAVILLVAGFLLTIPILWTLGIILLVAGLLFEVLGATGRAVGGRRHYY